MTELGDCGYYAIQPTLGYARDQNRTEAVKPLLDRGADVNKLSLNRCLPNPHGRGTKLLRPWFFTSPRKEGKSCGP